MKLKDNAMIQNKNSSYSDDGFPLGIAYVLKLLAQDEVFDTLHWFDSLREYMLAEEENVKNSSNKSAFFILKNAGNKAQTTKLALQLIQKKSKEYQLLETTVHSARILFN